MELWRPGVRYWAGEKVLIEPFPGRYSIWMSNGTRQSGAAWDATEEQEWTEIQDAGSAIIFSDVEPPPQVGKFWLKTDTWDMHVGYLNDQNEQIWVSYGFKGSRPVSGGGSATLPGGLPGQVIVKNSVYDGDYGWAFIDGGDNP